MAGFRHVVMFTWSDEATEEQRRAVVERLGELPAVIPEIRSYSLGTDAGTSPGNFDFVVVSDFADRQAYETYSANPVHRAVVEECITPIAVKRAAIQYELPD